jgi:hypothetical protein
VKLQRLGLLLAAWVVLALGPGIAVAAVYHGRTTDDLPNWVVPVWIAGFVAQFAVFLVASKMTGRTNALAGFVASLLPFVCDFGAPSSWWAVPLAAEIGLATAGEMFRAEYVRDQLAHNGIRATGTVLEVIEPKFWNVMVNSAYIYRTVRLRITRSDGVAPYEHKMRGLYMFGNVPDEGDKFALRVDPHDPNHFIVVHESLSDSNDRGGTRHTDWHVKSAGTEDDLGSSLDRIARLHESGQLTDDEFSRAKAKLLA